MCIWQTWNSHDEILLIQLFDVFDLIGWHCWFSYECINKWNICVAHERNQYTVTLTIIHTPIFSQLTRCTRKITSKMGVWIVVRVTVQSPFIIWVPEKCLCNVKNVLILSVYFFFSTRSATMDDQMKLETDYESDYTRFIARAQRKFSIRKRWKINRVLWRKCLHLKWHRLIIRLVAAAVAHKVLILYQQSSQPSQWLNRKTIAQMRFSRRHCKIISRKLPVPTMWKVHFQKWQPIIQSLPTVQLMLSTRKPPKSVNYSRQKAIVRINSIAIRACVNPVMERIKIDQKQHLWAIRTSIRRQRAEVNQKPPMISMIFSILLKVISHHPQTFNEISFIQNLKWF